VGRNKTLLVKKFVIKKVLKYKNSIILRIKKKENTNKRFLSKFLFLKLKNIKIKNKLNNNCLCAPTKKKYKYKIIKKLSRIYFFLESNFIITIGKNTEASRLYV
tara:strand:+ start:258 stop:569 length:312 start_codon:yes stop_codon:yes gene_type:complete